MPRKAQWPPAIHHHRASGQDRIRVKGEDIYLGPHDSAEARQKYAEIVARLSAGQEPLPPPPAPAESVTVQTIVVRWMEERAPRYSDRGREVAQFKRSVVPLLAMHEKTPAASFDADALEGVQLAMATGSWKKGARGWCRNVVNRRIVRIRTIWRWAERKKLVPPGAWANLRTVASLAPNDPRVRHTPRRKPCTYADLVMVALAAPRPVSAMLALVWWSGMRPGEVRRLRPCEIDRSGDVWLCRPGQHKNDWRGQGRVVLLGRRAQELLAPYLARCPGEESYLFPPSRKRKGARGCYSAETYSRAVARAANRVGVPGLHAYLARHAAKQRVTRAMGLDAARAFLGQKSIQSTDGYGEAIDLEQAREAARRLG